MNGQADRYRFGKFELIPSERRLLRDWHPVDLPPKIFDTLMVLVRAEGRAVSKRDLTEAIWPDTYVVENNLTKNISALRRLLGDDAIQTVSKFGYRLSMSGDAPPKRRVSPRLAVPLIAAVAIIVGLAAGFGRRSTDESDRIRSVVVVPLRVLRAADEQRYLADSIATAITNQLTSRRGVVVRASANSAADAIVRGTLQTNRETVQVFIEILDVRRNAIIWSRSFSAAASESPSFQANVAREVAGQLSAGLTKRERSALTPPRTADDVARTEYLLGRDLLDRRVGIVDAITHFETALSRDPNCALAWAGLAEALSRPYPGRRTEAEIQRAADAARRSLTIDPTLAEGHATLGFIELFHRWNWQNAEHQLRQALRYKPESARFHDWLAIALLPRGRITEARAMIDRAHALDPSSADIALDAVLVRYLARDFEGTERAAREVIRDMPAEGAVVRGFLVSSLALRGRYDEALAEMTNEEPTEIRPLFRMAIRYRRGEVAERAHLLAELADRTQIAQAVSCDEIAQIYAFAGEDGKAIEWLERAYEQRNFGLIFAGLDPMWDSLRGRPQFDSLLHRLGITPPES